MNTPEGEAGVDPTVTSMVAGPGVPVGVVAVRVEELMKEALSVAPPIVAVVWPATKPDPVMVMAVPPAVGPELGVTLVTLGGAVTTASPRTCPLSAK